jgi:hypothetical protein
MARQRTRSAPQTHLKETSWKLQDQVVEQALLTGTGQYAKDLDTLFGEAGHEELARLARQAAASRRRGGHKVIILPGIMGSKLGKKKGFLGIPYNDIYWFDPVDFALGIAQKLALDERGDPDVEALGVFLFVYLRLKFNLLIQGYDAEFYPFDWRKDIKQLGADLKDYIGSDSPSLVAHSMGGLVGRAAIKAGARPKHLIMLGTPNYGSFAPVQAMRGVDSLVKDVAYLSGGIDKLVSVFATFTGLCQMLPASSRYPATDFFDPASWPSSPPPVLSDVLKAASNVQDAFADADETFFLIAGCNQDTVVGARLDGEDFVYDNSPDGDGTVPLQFAILENLTDGNLYYAEQSHGMLPNDGSVIQAVKDILAEGATAALPTTRPAPRRALAVRTVKESDLRKVKPLAGKSRDELRVREYRNILATVAAPLAPAPIGAVPAPAVAAPVEQAAVAETYDQWQGLTVTRDWKHRLEIQDRQLQHHGRRCPRLRSRPVPRGHAQRGRRRHRSAPQRRHHRVHAETHVRRQRR